MSRLRADILKTHFSDYVSLIRSDRMMLLLSIVALVSLGSVIYWGSSIGHWRHDSYLYRDHAEMVMAVKTEGRWFGYLFTKLIRYVDPHLLWYTNIGLILGALFLAFRRLFDDSYVAFNLALIVLLFPGVFAQNMWPVIVFPAALLFLVSVIAIQRAGLYVLPASGALLFASLPFFYYILPLAFLPKGECRNYKDAARFVLPGVVWGVCLIFGYLVAAALNFYGFERFGIELSSWRKPHPVTDLSTLASNVERYAAQFIDDVSGWLPLWSLCVLAASFVACIARGKSHSAGPCTLIMRTGYALVVLLSPYLTVVLAGIGISHRSLLPLAVGFVVFPFLLIDRSLHRLLVVASAIAIGIPSFVQARAGVEWYARVTERNLLTMEKAAAFGAEYEGIVVDARQFEGYYQGIVDEIPNLPARPSFIEQLDRPSRLTPVLKELGVGSVLTCPRWFGGSTEPPLSRKCVRLIAEDIPADICSEELGPICIVGERDRWLIVRLMP